MKLERRGFFGIVFGGIAGLYTKYMKQAKAQGCWQHSRRDNQWEKYPVHPSRVDRFGPAPISVDSVKPGQFVQWGVLEQLDSPPEIPQAQLKPGQYIDKCEILTMMPIPLDDGLIFNVKYAYVIGTGDGDDRRGNPLPADAG